MPDKMTHLFDQFNYASLLQNAIRIAIIILIAILIWILVRVVIGRIGARIVAHAEDRGEDKEAGRRRAGTITSLIRKTVGAVYWIAIGLTLLSQIGVNISAMIASAGILGLAVSFGTREFEREFEGRAQEMMSHEVRIIVVG